jgi:hypothetical protein
MSIRKPNDYPCSARILASVPQKKTRSATDEHRWTPIGRSGYGVLAAVPASRAHQSAWSVQDKTLESSVFIGVHRWLKIFQKIRVEFHG